LVALGLTLVAAPASMAQSRITSLVPRTTSQEIVSYDVVAEVQPNTDMVITETIVYNPGTEEVRRGIIRDIPVRDSLDSGDLRLYDVQLLSVTRDGDQVLYTESTSDDAISLKIGDPNVPIQGLHTFVISYRVGGALNIIDTNSINATTPKGITAGDISLYWDFIGGQWPFPVIKGKATITGPTPALGALCFFGPQGFTKPCEVMEGVGPDSATVLSADLRDGGSLTGAVAWAPDGFTQMPKPNIVPDPSADDIARLNSLFPLILLLALIALAAPITMAILRRRSNSGVVLAATPVRYQPPDGVRPAQMQAGIDGSVDARGYTATLLDLAARGHLMLSEVEGGMFRRTTLSVTWTGAGKDALSPWESDLAGAILKGSSSATIGTYDPTLTTMTLALTNQLSKEAKASGRYNLEGDKPDRVYTVLAVLGGVAIPAGFVFLAIPDWGITLASLDVLAGIGLLIGGIIGRIITPRRQSRASADFLGQVAGFTRLLDSDSADARRDYAVKIGLPPEAIFATFLPFAVILGLESTWVGNFPDITPEQLRPYGLDTLAIGGLAGWSSTMSSNWTSSTVDPTSSSGGSGFGGGGSSGGGGGGGGGGSF
jgi:uncharacterized membrane protein YgcG